MLQGILNHHKREACGMTSVSVRNLYKSYAGKPAVKDLSFTVEPGEILGLIGPNGAGKSSAIKMILDFIKPDSGDVTVFGAQMGESSKNKIGYLPEEKGLYKNLTAIELILYLASLKGVDKNAARGKARELLERMGMLGSEKKKIKEMSKGMGQMIQLIVTVIHNPSLLILDEPFSGLDPVNVEIVKSIIGESRNQGKAVVLSTHQMNQVEELCDRVLMIDHGSAVLYGDLKELTSKFRNKSVVVSVEGEIGDLPGIVETNRRKDSLELVPAPDVSPMMILDQLRARGILINRFEIATPSLNEIFLKLAGAEHE
jgi:ABC-2 type transport system ATP-binding protein